MTRAQIEREFILRCDYARQWIRDARLGETRDGQLLSPEEISAYVQRGRIMQWNALSWRRWHMKRLQTRENAA